MEGLQGDRWPKDTGDMKVLQDGSLTWKGWSPTQVPRTVVPTKEIFPDGKKNKSKCGFLAEGCLVEAARWRLLASTGVFGN